MKNPYAPILVPVLTVMAFLAGAALANAATVEFDFNFSTAGSGTIVYDDVAMDIPVLDYDFGAFGSTSTSFGAALTLAVFGAPPNTTVNNDNVFFGLSGGTASGLRLSSDGTFCVRPDPDICGGPSNMTADLASGTYNIAPVTSVVEVDIDIKPGSDPNCFNINGNGVIPVAILGSAGFDVLDIDTNTLFFAGLEVRVRGKKGPLCHGESSNGDEFLDLICQFEDDPAIWAPDSGVEATLTGNLMNNDEFEGTDSICIVP